MIEAIFRRTIAESSMMLSRRQISALKLLVASAHFADNRAKLRTHLPRLLTLRLALTRTAGTHMYQSILNVLSSR